VRSPKKYDITRLLRNNALQYAERVSCQFLSSASLSRAKFLARPNEIVERIAVEL
jgi:hypothetical protein